MMLAPRMLLFGVASAAVLVLAAPSAATDGDLYARGTRYCTSTYSPGHDTPKRFGPPIDINAAGGDLGRPVYAPTAGTVRVFSSAGIYGRSVVWRSADGWERLHVAHLDRIVRTGSVEGGELIGRAGSSGHAFGEGHLHVARQMGGRPAPLVLSGRSVDAGRCFRSSGSIRARCLGAAATILGSGRSEPIHGTPGEDVIVSGSGGDRVGGRGGDDLLCGGTGDDLLNGQVGTDRVDGGPGTDTCALGDEASACELPPGSSTARPLPR
jgi:peptidase M23-like protein/hemolysin type calcium-binding protein